MNKQTSISTASPRSTSQPVHRMSFQQKTILHTVSKLFILVIATSICTILLIGMVIYRLMFDELTIWPQTLISITMGMDILCGMFAIFSQFDFGNKLYQILCTKFHNPVFNKCSTSKK